MTAFLESAANLTVGLSRGSSRGRNPTWGDREGDYGSAWRLDVELSKVAEKFAE